MTKTLKLKLIPFARGRKCLNILKYIAGRDSVADDVTLETTYHLVDFPKNLDAVGDEQISDSAKVQVFPQQQKKNLSVVSPPNYPLRITCMGKSNRLPHRPPSNLQNRALRLILNAPIYRKRIDQHRDLRIPALTSRIKKLATTFHDQVASHPQ
ncbi:hypothetical protein TNCV_3739581 [Trichonephila clavipes]|nr:hypothetical protein TNCV_3739581 [Trichonephila clavipes]